MAHVDTPWTRLASRTARALLVRKGISYEELPGLLAAVGVNESARSAEGKVQRGSFRCVFFLQLVYALHADLPQPLQQLFDARVSWEDAAKQLFLSGLADHSLTFSGLSKKLSTASGLNVDASQVEHQVMAGTYPLTLLLQLSLVAPMAGLDRFVDASDVRKAATEQALAAS
ncbi:hypothetical protein D9M68_134650 [compost metagenome]